MIEFAISNGSSPDHQGAISYRFGNTIKLLGSFQQRRTAHGRASLAECEPVGIDDAQTATSKVTHGTGRRADIQRIPRAHQHDDEVG